MPIVYMVLVLALVYSTECQRGLYTHRFCILLRRLGVFMGLRHPGLDIGIVTSSRLLASLTLHFFICKVGVLRIRTNMIQISSTKV